VTAICNLLTVVTISRVEPGWPAAPSRYRSRLQSRKFDRPPASSRPVCRDPGERTRVIHIAHELNRLTANLAVLDITERACRQVHGGFKSFSTIRALDRNEFRGLQQLRTTRFKNGLEPVQRINGLRIEWFARFPGHAGNLHHPKPSKAGSARERVKFAEHFVPNPQPHFIEPAV
jgi:hypothetical protein